MAIVAVIALTPGQVRAEADPEPEETPGVVCEGLGSLTMGVNTMTLQRQGTLTKHTSSTDGECKMSLTLTDASSEDNPADRTKSCTVTVTPVWIGNALDLTSTESGDCDTVATDVIIDYGGSLPGGWAAYSGPTEDPQAATPDSGVVGAAGCVFTPRGAYVHPSGGDASGHGSWWVVKNSGCPDKARVTVYLQAFGCFNICDWVTVAWNSEWVKPKNVNKDEVVARKRCNGTTETGWRSIAHSNPEGRAIGAKWIITLWQNFDCNP